MASKNLTKVVKEQNLKKGDIIWAKMKGHPTWPALIGNPPVNIPPVNSKKFVIFFGDCSGAWMSDYQLMPFEENREKFSKIKRVKFQIAMLATEKYIAYLVKQEDLGKPQNLSLSVKLKALKRFSLASREEMMNVPLTEVKLTKEIKKEINTENFSKKNSKSLIDDEVTNKRQMEINTGNISKKLKLSKSVIDSEDVLAEGSYQLDPKENDSNIAHAKVRRGRSSGLKHDEDVFLPAGDGPSTSKEMFGKEHIAQRYFLGKLDLCDASLMPEKPKKSTGSNMNNLKRSCNAESIKVKKGKIENTSNNIESSQSNAESIKIKTENVSNNIESSQSVDNAESIKVKVKTENTSNNIESSQSVDENDSNVSHAKDSKLRRGRSAGFKQENEDVLAQGSCQLEPKENDSNVAHRQLRRGRSAGFKQDNTKAAENKTAEPKKEPKHIVPDPVPQPILDPIPDPVPVNADVEPPEPPTMFSRYHILQILGNFYWKAFWDVDYSPRK